MSGDDQQDEGPKPQSKSMGLRAGLFALCMIILFALGIYAHLGPLVLVSVSVIIGLLLLVEAILPPSVSKQRISRGLCPHCGHDLSDIASGTEYCPGCSQPIPAPLRKWSSKSG